jgi:hypothetical protein
MPERRRPVADPWRLLPLTADEAQLLRAYRQLSPKLQRSAQRVVRSVNVNEERPRPTRRGPTRR